MPKLMPTIKKKLILLVAQCFLGFALKPQLGHKAKLLMIAKGFHQMIACKPTTILCKTDRSMHIFSLAISMLTCEVTLLASIVKATNSFNSFSCDIFHLWLKTLLLYYFAFLIYIGILSNGSHYILQ